MMSLKLQQKQLKLVNSLSLQQLLIVFSKKKKVTVNSPSRLTHTVRAVNTNPLLKFKREFTTVLFSTATKQQHRIPLCDLLIYNKKRQHCLILDREEEGIYSTCGSFL